MVPNEMVMWVYVLCIMGYQCVIRYEYTYDTIDMHCNGLFDNKNHDNKIAWTYRMLQYNSMISEYYASVTYHVTVLWLCEHHICHP